MSPKSNYERRMYDLRLEINRQLVDESYNARKERYELETRGRNGHYPFGRRCRICNNLSPYGHHPFYFKDSDEWLNLHVYDWVPDHQCQFCVFLNRVFRHHFGNSKPPRRFNLKMKPGYPLYLTDIHDTHHDRWIDCIEVFKDIENDVPAWSKTPFIGGGPMIFNHSNDQGVYDFISNCLSECEKTHTSCQALDPLPLPKRLLLVNEKNQSCKLVEPPQDQQGAYTALSYCWGKGNRNALILTQDNYSSFQDNISWHRLPPLFQDAIKITNHLRIDYIWIDSLCIIQDDNEDWEIESQNMASIFENAHITIMAASSPDPETPILRQRAQCEERFKFDFTEKNQSKSYLFSRLTTPEDMFHLHPVQVKEVSSRGWGEVLYQRGWTFQEDLLARRTIHYLPQRVVWECRMLHDDERQLLGNRRLANSFDQTVWTWREYVKAYTKRDLTYISDKLPAISGIANMVAQKMGDEYLAGLWRSSLISDLGWQFAYSSTAERTSPPRQYIAPSWSWASVATRQAIGYSSDRVLNTVATVIDAGVTLKGRNRFGEVSDGFVQLRGFVRKIKLYCENKRELFKAYFPGCEVSVESLHFRADMEICSGDGLLESGAMAPTLCRRYAHEKYQPKSGKDAYPAVWVVILYETLECITGIVLGRSPRVQGAYERLGLLEFDPRDFGTAMELAVESTITIV
ncbi:HET-domain-containing protein [Aspergillus caelatus]|uniref:HET-domain-containing protein n=1 Tax=Aspergillus caelatus TaxID=61420 RepID=A0A5N7AM31_9EURO|nr:HET-domain-containing protein [Aspergillus caelatus]KAE8370753.1 HET-domain-containing protein [Aspergillus caelatus]